MQLDTTALYYIVLCYKSKQRLKEILLNIQCMPDWLPQHHFKSTLKMPGLKQGHLCDNWLQSKNRHCSVSAVLYTVHIKYIQYTSFTISHLATHTIWSQNCGQRIMQNCAVKCSLALYRKKFIRATTQVWIIYSICKFQTQLHTLCSQWSKHIFTNSAGQHRQCI